MPTSGNTTYDEGGIVQAYNGIDLGNTGSDTFFRRQVFYRQTTDANDANVTEARLVLGENQVGRMLVVILAISDDGSTMWDAWEGVAHRDGSGDITWQTDSPINGLDRGDGADSASAFTTMSLTTGTQSIDIVLTGVSSTNMNWQLYVEHSILDRPAAP